MLRNTLLISFFSVFLFLVDLFFAAFFQGFYFSLLLPFFILSLSKNHFIITNQASLLSLESFLETGVFCLEPLKLLFIIYINSKTSKIVNSDTISTIFLILIYTALSLFIELFALKSGSLRFTIGKISASIIVIISNLVIAKIFEIRGRLSSRF